MRADCVPNDRTRKENAGDCFLWSCSFSFHFAAGAGRMKEVEKLESLREDWLCESGAEGQSHRGSQAGSCELFFDSLLEEAQRGGSEHLPSAAAVTQADVSIKLWQNGFTVNGEFRSYGDGASQQFLNAIRKGELPSELRGRFSQEEVAVRVEDKKEQVFVPRKPAFAPFSGRGHRLGSATPRIVSKASGGGGRAPEAPGGPSRPPEPLGARHQHPDLVGRRQEARPEVQRVAQGEPRPGLHPELRGLAEERPLQPGHGSSGPAATGRRAHAGGGGAAERRGHPETPRPPGSRRLTAFRARCSPGRLLAGVKSGGRSHGKAVLSGGGRPTLQHLPAPARARRAVTRETQ
uniref:UBX domain protein 2A n=1 Tax=Monodelphis domestica TaxID=13616 RepID=H9H5Z5_MONDO